MNLAIYGAQGYALGAYKAIKTLYPRREISCFLVTRMDGNPQTLGGIPVKTLAAYAGELSREEKGQVEILIATPDKVQPDIEEILENFGFRQHRRLTFSRWTELMKLFHARQGTFLPLSALPVGCHMPFIRMYMAKSHVDKPLRDNVSLPEYVLPLQAGADCCDVRVADLADNTGEHISWKNGNYCELTALYWMWKNKLAAVGAVDGEEGQNTSQMAMEIKDVIREIPEIVMTGTMDREEIHKTLACADVLICPSREDPMPTVAAEAMMHGVPCMVSDATGTAAYIDQEVDGIVFHCEDEWDLAERIRWCVEHRERLSDMGSGARTIYDRYFSMTAFEKKVMELL